MLVTFPINRDYLAFTLRQNHHMDSMSPFGGQEITGNCQMNFNRETKSKLQPLTKKLQCEYNHKAQQCQTWVFSHLLADFSSWKQSSWMYMEPVETCRNDLKWGTVAMPTRKSALLATVLLFTGPASSSSRLGVPLSCSHCPIGSGRYPIWKSLPWHACMKNILGFPASVGAFWLLKGSVSCWRSTFISSCP